MKGENRPDWKGGRKASYQRRWSDVKFRLSIRMSTSIKEHLRQGVKGGQSWQILTGYTINDLKKHLKRTIPNGYTWKDFLDGKLHVDHIIPINEFQFSSPNDLQFKKCWALGNLRLLPAKENISKNAKLIKPYQTTLQI